jgi:hypothetical protein
VHRICFDGAAVRHNLDCCTDNSTRGEDLLHVNKASGSIRGFSFFVLDAARENRWLGVRAAEGTRLSRMIHEKDTLREFPTASGWRVTTGQFQTVDSGHRVNWR